VAIGEAAARIERAGHLAVLKSLDVDRPSVVIGGARFAKVGRCEATYYTLAGPVVVERSLYREVGRRNAKVVDPVSLRAGVVEHGWLPRTASAMAHQVQQATSREAEESARQLGRLPYSRSSFERVAHAMGALYVPAHGDIEDALIEQYEIPAAARSVSVSLDRVSVPMEEPLPRPVGRPKKGAPKRPVARNFRMAYCATVTLHDGDGDAQQSGRDHVQVGESRPVHDAITYIENNGKRMDYAAARRRGLPVGSGNVEATCKSLVEVRMKRPGARWKEKSGEHIIPLRAVALSDRWDAAIDLTMKPLRKAVRLA